MDLQAQLPIQPQNRIYVPGNLSGSHQPTTGLAGLAFDLLTFRPLNAPQSLTPAIILNPAP